MKDNKVVFFAKPAKQGERMYFEVPKGVKPLILELTDTCKVTVENE